MKDFCETNGNELLLVKTFDKKKVTLYLKVENFNHYLDSITSKELKLANLALEKQLPYLAKLSDKEVL